MIEKSSRATVRDRGRVEVSVRIGLRLVFMVAVQVGLDVSG